MTLIRTAARAATVVAAATMVATPVAAATRIIPITVPLSAKPAPHTAWSKAEESWNDRRWRRDRHHRGGIDGGDLLGVLLIGGGIAAIAAAIDKDKDERRRDRTRGRDYPRPDRPYGYRGDRSDGRDYDGAERPYDYRGGAREQDRGYGRRDDGDRGEADRAVEACEAEAGRNGQIDEIFEVERIDGEWRVKGDYRNGREFTCSVDGNGRAYVGLGDQSRNEVSAVPGAGAEAATAQSDDTDDRYATAQSPDFADPRGN